MENNNLRILFRNKRVLRNVQQNICTWENKLHLIINTINYRDARGDVGPDLYNAIKKLLNE